MNKPGRTKRQLKQKEGNRFYILFVLDAVHTWADHSPADRLFIAKSTFLAIQ